MKAEEFKAWLAAGVEVDPPAKKSNRVEASSIKVTVDGAPVDVSGSLAALEDELDGGVTTGHGRGCACVVCRAKRATGAIKGVGKSFKEAEESMKKLGDAFETVGDAYGNEYRIPVKR